jgi:hypothetical protein
MNFSTSVASFDVYADFSGACALVHVGAATYSVTYTGARTTVHLVAGRPRGMAARKMAEQAQRAAFRAWNLSDDYKARCAALYSA